MYCTTSFSQDRRLISGVNEQGLVFTLGIHHNMQEQWHSYFHFQPVWSVHSSMSELTHDFKHSARHSTTGIQSHNGRADKCHFTQEDAQAKQQMQDEDMPLPEGAQILPNELQGTANDSASQGETQDTMSGLLSQHPIGCSSTVRLLHASTKQSSPRDTTRHDRTLLISETMMPNATLH